MRRTLAAAALAAAALAAHLAPAVASAETTRAFAVGPRISPDWLDTRAHFHDKLVALVDARERGKPGVPPVQAGAGDVASHLLGGGRDLVTLPEDLGLLAAFTGERGAAARETGDLVSAIVALIGSYAPVSAYYGERFPALTQRPLPTRLLAVSLTDTFGRTAVETFAEIADRLDATVVAGVNMARDWRIVCVSRATFTPPPGARGCDVEDPALVARLRSPDEPGRDYAYEATTPDAVNMALVFGPDGQLIDKQVKAYLTPIELPSQLDLVPGAPSALRAVATPAGRLGIVTSKDAWMPDVLDRLDADGAEILVQPEFFVGETVGPNGMWAPDNLKASGYSDVLRHPSLQALVLPSLTGNLFDFSADAQSHLVLKPRLAGDGPRGQMVGQAPAAGFAAVMPFAVPDPVGEPILARRETLARAGAAQLPLAANPSCPSIEPGACRGGQVEGTVFTDVDRDPAVVRAKVRATAPFSAARAIAPSRRAQRNVALSARGRLVVAAWEEQRADGAWTVRAARSADAGRTWGRPDDLGPGAAPSVAIGEGGARRAPGSSRARRGAGPRVWVAFAGRGGQIALWTAVARGPLKHAASTSLGARDAGQWTPSIAATGRDTAFLAWIDERARQAEGGGPRATAYGAVVRGGRIAAPIELGDAPATNDLARSLDNDWAISVGAHGGAVTVAWTDFRSYDWRIVARSSRDGGARFGRLATVSDGPADREVLDDAPSVAVGARGASVAWTNYVAAPTLAPAPLYDVRLRRLDDRAMAVDDHGGAQVVSVNPALALTARGAPLVAFQDHARGVGTIRLSLGGRIRTVSASPANQWRPAVARAGRRAVIAWEDARNGPPQVRVSNVALGRLD